MNAAPLRKMEILQSLSRANWSFNTPATPAEAAKLVDELRILAAQVECQADVMEEYLQRGAL